MDICCGKILEETILNSLIVVNNYIKINYKNKKTKNSRFENLFTITYFTIINHLFKYFFIYFFMNKNCFDFYI